VQNMDLDYLPSLKGVVEVFKHACCANFRQYSLQHVSWQGLQVLLDCKKHCSCLSGPIMACSSTDMRSSYKKCPVHRSEIEQPMSSVLHVDFDIGQGGVVSALERITGLWSCRPFCMLLSKTSRKT
jgi:hypothetical protein